MSQTFRLTEILEIARRDRKVAVEDLATHFGVAPQTIRRDLTELAESGKLERVHGGAVVPSRTVNLGYEDRRELNSDAKAEIARNCAADIPNDCSVFLNIGTSTEAVAAEMLDHENLLVVTNNMNVANILGQTAGFRVIVTGGVLRRTDGGLLGELAISTIQQFKFDIGVIGCSALDADGDILDYDLEEVAVSQAILRHSRRRFLVADHSKFRRSAPARIAGLSEIDVFYTNVRLPNALQARCRDWNTDVRICDGAGLHRSPG